MSMASAGCRWRPSLLHVAILLHELVATCSVSLNTVFEETMRSRSPGRFSVYATTGEYTECRGVPIARRYGHLGAPFPVQSERILFAGFQHYLKRGRIGESMVGTRFDQSFGR